jgi:hypothetical protein
MQIPALPFYSTTLQTAVCLPSGTALFRRSAAFSAFNFALFAFPFCLFPFATV